MEIVYFILGVVTVLLVLGVVVIVRVITSVKGLKEEVQQLEKVVGDAFSDIRNLHRRIDDQRRELALPIKDTLDIVSDIKDVLHKRIDEVERSIEDYSRKLTSELDSRLDKLDSKIKQKDLLKG
jgi:prefoldin subunit 5